MTFTITMPDEIATQLKRKARQEHRSVEELAVELLSQALEQEKFWLSPEDVVAKMRALPPNPGGCRSASGSLAEALRQAPEDPDFDLARWEQEWANVETEMRAVTRANATIEGQL